MSNRSQNERKFPQWMALFGGGRRYWRDVVGHQGWRARYVKEVDEEERTVSFHQEIFDPTGALAEVHKIFPIDTGHQPVQFEEDNSDYA